MIDNLHNRRSHFRSKQNHRWWQKVKNLLLGHWMKHPIIKEDLTFVAPIRDKSGFKSSLKDWVKAVDILQSLVQSTRAQLDPNSMGDFDLELIGANTYLFHVDRLLAKLREYYLNFRYCKDFPIEQHELVSKTEYIQAMEAAEQCYHTMNHLTELIRRNANKRLYSEEFISQIHAFELEVSTLGCVVVTLNKYLYRQEALYQLSALELDLFQTLDQHPSPAHNTFSFNNVGSQQGTMYTGEYLRSKSHVVTHPDYVEFIKEIINIHDMLKKCYVVARKSVIKESLELMSENIEGLIGVFSQDNVEKQKAFTYLSEIFNCVEALRFSTNRDSRCSRNLFDKSKLARQQLRKICAKNEITREFLKFVSVKRISLIKSR